MVVPKEENGLFVEENEGPNIRHLLREGLAHERAGEWEAAFEFWSACLAQLPDEIAFYLRQSTAALRTQKPDHALSSVRTARKLDIEGKHSEALDGLQVRAEKLQVSLFRIRGFEAFEAGNYELARQNFEALALAVPDHPWAEGRARQAAGFSPLFAQRLAEQLPLVRQRIFLTGCGRSGTWLLTAMLHCIPDIRQAKQESPLGSFLDMPNEARVHLVKRPHDAYKHFDKIPSDIKVLHVIRHPFDVLCSRHRKTERYISMARLEAEHAAFFSHLVDRPQTHIVKYEDMVLRPTDVQSEVEEFLGVTSGSLFSEFHRASDMSEDVVEAMHGLRPLDTSALYRWRTSETDTAYLKEQIQKSDGTLKRFAQYWGYRIELENWC